MRLYLILLILITLILLLIPHIIVIEKDKSSEEYRIEDAIGEFLASKNSPLAQEVSLLMRQKHWKLLIAISAIESQYCTRKLGNNCWGIGGDSSYRYYASIDDAIIDANNLIEYWQAKGRWLTVEDMNGHYVVPSNPNWVAVVNKNLNDIERIISRASGISIQNDERVEASLGNKSLLNAGV